MNNEQNIDIFSDDNEYKEAVNKRYRSFLKWGRQFIEEYKGFTFDDTDIESACRIYWKFRKKATSIRNIKKINRFKIAFLTSIAVLKVKPLNNNLSLQSSTEEIKEANLKLSIYIASQLLNALCGNRLPLNDSAINKRNECEKILKDTDNKRDISITNLEMAWKSYCFELYTNQNCVKNCENPPLCKN